MMKRRRRTSSAPWCERLESRRMLAVDFAIAHVDVDLADQVTALGTADLDGDGDQDIVSAIQQDATLSHQIGWYENLDGAGTFSDRRPIDDGQAGGSVSWIDAADLDGDGDADIVGASLALQQIFWFENTNGSGTFAKAQVATPTRAGDISVELVDLDNDQDVDLVWGSVFENAVLWNENNGQGVFSQAEMIADNLPSIQDTLTGDVNGDGLHDIVVASLDFLNPRLAWFENSGNGNFSSERTVASGQAILAVDAGDVDGDGDLDFVTSLYGQTSWGWIENTDGQGTFAEQQTLTATPLDSLPRDVRLVDLDGNGQLDVLGVPLVGQGRPVTLSDSNGHATELVEMAVEGANHFAVGDFNGDAVADVVLDSNQGLQYATTSDNAPRVIGDSNGDGVFDSADIVAVFVAGLYETGQPATFEQGDWNGDGVFSTSDLVAAFIAGTYVSDARLAARAVADPTKPTVAADLPDVSQTVTLKSLTRPDLASSLRYVLEASRDER